MATTPNTTIAVDKKIIRNRGTLFPESLRGGAKRSARIEPFKRPRPVRMVSMTLLSDLLRCMEAMVVAKQALTRKLQICRRRNCLEFASVLEYLQGPNAARGGLLSYC